MNTMNMPGFTAEASLYTVSGRYQSEAARRVGGEKQDNHVYMQKPNRDNTAGGKCHATHSNGTISSGTYNSEGYCCAPTSTGKLCVNCDSPNNTCGDEDAPQRGIFDRLGLFALPTEMVLFRLM